MLLKGGMGVGKSCLVRELGERVGRKLGQGLLTLQVSDSTQHRLQAAGWSLQMHGAAWGVP